MKWSDVGNKLRSVAGTALPVIGTALGGPAGGAAGVLLAKALGTDATPDAVAAALSPASLVKLREIEADLQRAQIAADSAALTGQLDVNKVEAASDSLFVAGWRPAIGWVCAVAFFWTFVLAPLLAFVAALAGYTGKLPEMDLSELLPVLAGMLGLGYLRTKEKLSGVSAGH